MSAPLGSMPVHYYNNDTSRSVARYYEDDYLARIRYSRFWSVVFLFFCITENAKMKNS